MTHNACAGMPRDVCDVVAESVAYAVCSRFGLDLSLSSVEYVAGWGHPQGHNPEAFRVGMAAIHDGAASLIDAIELPSQNSLAGSPPAPNHRHPTQDRLNRSPRYTPARSQWPLADCSTHASRSNRRDLPSAISP